LGENIVPHALGLLPRFGVPKGLFAFAACGVMIMGSSLSSGSIMSPSSELVLDSPSSIFMLPTELDGAVLSPFPIPHAIWFTLGESRSMEFARGFRDGIIIPF
jgi:hypothetical protein